MNNIRMLANSTTGLSRIGRMERSRATITDGGTCFRFFCGRVGASSLWPSVLTVRDATRKQPGRISANAGRCHLGLQVRIKDEILVKLSRRSLQSQNSSSLARQSDCGMGNRIINKKGRQAALSYVPWTRNSRGTALTQPVGRPRPLVRRPVRPSCRCRSW